MKNDIGALQQKIQSTIWSRGRIGNYEIVRKIGEGSFSSVFLAVHVMTRHEVVLKSAEKTQLNLAAEIANMSLLSHPHIVRLYEYIVTSDKVWLVLEYCGGEELFNHLVMSKVIVPSQACKLFAQLAGAVAYAHQLHCAHRDLKLENVLLDEDGNIKLGDFGFTRSYLPRTMLETVCGTESYMAPELLLHQRYNPEAADVWSLGVILYALIYGKLPFDEDNTAETVKKIVEEDPPFLPVPKGEYLVGIARKMLRKQPSQRPKVIEMLDELREPGRLQKQLLSKIINFPESSYIFSSKEERTVLKGMKALSIDLHTMASSIVHHKCDPLHGLWYSALDRQRALSKQANAESTVSSTTAALHRRKSKASIRSSKSHTSQRNSRSAGGARLGTGTATLGAGDLTSDSIFRDRENSYTNAEPDDESDDMRRPSSAQVSFSSPQPLHYTQQLQLQSQLQSQQQQQDHQFQQKHDQQALVIEQQQQQQVQLQSQIQNQQQILQQMQKSSAEAAKPQSQPLKTPTNKNSVQNRVNEFIDRRSTGRSRRAMEKIVNALKIRRHNGKDTLMAYYKPAIDDQKVIVGAKNSDSSPSFTSNATKAAVGGTAGCGAATSAGTSVGDTARMNGPAANYANTIANNIHASIPLNTSSNGASINSATSVRRVSSPVLDLSRSSPPASRRHSALSNASSTSLSFSETPVKNSGSGNSMGQTPSTPALGSQISQSTMSRQMSTYSQISQVSQLSQSSVEPSQLLADASDSPKSTAPKGSRWSSSSAWKFAGMAQPPTSMSASTSTPPGTPLLSRLRPAAGRLVSVQEKIPSKIDEGENESEG